MVTNSENLEPMKEGLVRLVLSLEDHAARALEEQNLTSEDRAALYSAMHELKPSFVALADGVVEPLSEGAPETAELAYELVWRFVSVVLRIAGPVIFTDSTKHIFAPIIRKEAAASQAASARAARVPKTSARKKRLRAAILSEAGNEELVASAGFAESLVDGVQKRLGGSKGASARTIEREISAILKERRESQRHS